MNKRQREKIDKRLHCFTWGKGKNKGYKQRKAEFENFWKNWDGRVGHYTGFQIIEDTRE